MPEVFTVGGLSIDNIVAADGSVRCHVMGGNAVYSAAGARLWLDDVGVAGLVPRNYPAAFLDHLRLARIDTEAVVSVDEQVDRFEWFFYNDSGSRIDQIHAAPDAFQAFGLSGNRIDKADAARFAEHLKSTQTPGRTFGAFRLDHPVQIGHLPPGYSGAIGAHLAANRPDALRRMAQALSERAMTITLDPGSNAARLGDERADLGFPAMDVFLPSERELHQLTRQGSIGERLTELMSSGLAALVVKMGAQGSMLVGASLDAPLTVPALPVNAIDPTGAGDAYCGGFLAGYVRTRDILTSACLGTVSASFAVEAFGPLRLLQATRFAAHARLGRLMAVLTEPLQAKISAAVPNIARVFP